MATGPVSQILFHTAIAAVNSTSHLRVYTQDVFGNIRESLYESGWANGTINNVIAQAKIGSPIAATSKELNEIRVYYISTDNKLREQAYSAGKGWYAGGLNNSNIEVAPYSKVAATFLPGSALVLRVYVQSPDNTIQEYGYDSAASGWQKMTNIGAALTGSELAATSYQTSQLSIRVYLQDTSLNLIEKAYDANSGWYTGAFGVKSALPRTALACTSFGATSSSISIRVYYAAPNERMLEKAWDTNSWYDGGFNEPSIPGSEVAVINWGSGSGLNLRVYLQNGTDVTGVSEWVWNGSWSPGVAAIPPA